MPYKFDTDKLKMKSEDKRNIKLTADDKEEIRKLYETGLFSQRQLAREFNVSRSSIVFAIYPDKYEISREQFKKRQKTGIYYDKEKHREYTRKHRQHKKELYLEGKLIKD